MTGKLIYYCLLPTAHCLTPTRLFWVGRALENGGKINHRYLQAKKVMIGWFVVIVSNIIDQLYSEAKKINQLFVPTVEKIKQLDIVPEIIKMQRAVLEHCDRMDTRFAILDGLKNVDELERQRKALSSHNGALYAPCLRVEHRSDVIPPCGHIAGIYASCDRKVGIHGAPANIPLEGVLDLSFSLTSEQQNQLNPKNEPGVNCIRSLGGRGMRVWGVRTLSGETEWQYINVRRLFLTFGRWVNQNLADTVFEPNDVSLWLRLTRELKVYCESLWSQGALQGAVPQEAFYVKCDEEINPPENREMGQVIAEVGLAPTIPGEFIQLLLVQNSSGITLA